MNIIHTYLSWVIAHPLKDLVAFVVLCNLIVAVTPVRYQKTKIFGMFLVVANRASVLVHADSHGTLQWPLIAKAIVFGTVDAPALVPALAAAPVVAPAEAPAESTPASPETKL